MMVTLKSIVVWDSPRFTFMQEDKLAKLNSLVNDVYRVGQKWHNGLCANNFMKY